MFRVRSSYPITPPVGRHTNIPKGRYCLLNEDVNSPLTIKSYGKVKGWFACAFGKAQKLTTNKEIVYLNKTSFKNRVTNYCKAQRQLPEKETDILVAELTNRFVSKESSKNNWEDKVCIEFEAKYQRSLNTIKETKNSICVSEKKTYESPLQNNTAPQSYPIFAESASKIILPGTPNKKNIPYQQYRFLFSLTDGKEKFKINKENQVEPVTISLANNIAINGVFINGDNNQQEAVNMRSLNHNDKTVVLFCANASSYTDNLDLVEFYRHNYPGWNIMLFDYRGTGQSSESTLAKSSNDVTNDATAVIEFLMKQKGIQEDQLVLHGLSIGGAVAASLTPKYPKVSLILDRTFTKLTDVITPHLAQKISCLEYAPIRWIAKQIIRRTNWEMNTIGLSLRKRKDIYITVKGDEILAPESRLKRKNSTESVSEANSNANTETKEESDINKNELQLMKKDQHCSDNHTREYTEEESKLLANLINQYVLDSTVLHSSPKVTDWLYGTQLDSLPYYRKNYNKNIYITNEKLVKNTLFRLK